MEISYTAMVLRMATATALGAAIGWEREQAGRPAGLRTHLLVSIASSTFMLVSTQFVYSQSYAPGDLIETDPSRIAASVVTGVGFLGSGAILRRGLGVHGLTTAASLWLVAAVGLAAGGGMYLVASVATVLALFCLAVLRRVEGRKGRRIVRRIALTIEDQQTSNSELLAQLSRAGAEITTVDYQRRMKDNKSSILLNVRLKSAAELEQLVKSLEELPGAKRIRIHQPS